MANKNTFENLQDIFIFLKNVFKKNLMNQNQNHSHFFSLINLVWEPPYFVKYIFIPEMDRQAMARR